MEALNETSNLLLKPLLQKTPNQEIFKANWVDDLLEIWTAKANGNIDWYVIKHQDRIKLKLLVVFFSNLKKTSFLQIDPYDR